MPRGARYLYNLNFFCGFLVASGVYWILCRWFPVPATSKAWREEGGDGGGMDRMGGVDEESSFEKEERGTGAGAGAGAEKR